MMNHKLLLVKYLRHVGNVEGMTLTSDDWRRDADGLFTREEWEELQYLANAANTVTEDILAKLDSMEDVS